MDNDLDHDVAVLWSMLLEIISDAEKRLSAHMARHNLTPPQFFVLKTLFENKGRCAIGKIAKAHHLTNPTLTGLINRLEAMQPPLVVRERSATDRRSIMVVLTAAGEERFWAIQHDLLQQVRFILSMINKEERQDVIEKIARYVKVIMHHFPVSEI